MPRVDITKELSDFLRSMRTQNKVPAIELADKINKSPAYISRIENGTIKSIDSENLYALFKILIHENNDKKIAEGIYRSLRIKYKSEEIDKQLWFKNFDTVKCLIPIPDELIDSINNMINSLGIERKQLLFRINSNEALPEKDIINKSIPTNLWYISDFHGQRIKSSIKIEMTAQKLDAILDKVDKNSSYIYIMAIVYYLHKIDKYQERKSITDDENQELMNTVTVYLNKYNFYSVLEKENLLSRTKTQEEYRQILNSFDIENYELVCDILSEVKYVSDCNITYANEKLKAFSENMHWDLGFMLKIVSLNFQELFDLSVTEKTALINEIEMLIDKYLEKSRDRQQIEYY